MAIRLSMVSRMVSPLDCDEVLTLRLMTSADKRLAAISKVVRVRVLFSKKILQTVLPRNRGTFFTSRSATPTKDSAVSRIWFNILRGRPSIDSRCFSLPSSLSCGLCINRFLPVADKNVHRHGAVVVDSYQRPGQYQRC